MLLLIKWRMMFIKAFCNPFATALQTRRNDVATAHENDEKELKITPQVWSIEKMLNDRFDMSQRRIYLSETPRLRGNFYFRPTDNKPWFHLDTFYISERRLGFANDFIVNCPAHLRAQEDRIIATINQYKLISKQFTINYE